MDLDEKRTYYLALCHAMQSGVGLEIQERFDGSAATPKHLRVGVNVAMCEHGAVVALLIAKGLFTEEEYIDSMIEKMEEEVRKYQERSQRYLADRPS